MLSQKTDTMPLVGDEDVVRVRQRVRDQAAKLGFSLVDQTKIVTAASELARNTIIHGGGGSVTLEVLRRDGHAGLQLLFEDSGPGIADLGLALKDGFSTGTGLGLGLSGSKRLMSEFEIDSTPGAGTKVRVARWK
jgi:serine/threonine-protein kinase RsbT